jgi:hypothetical protein
MSGKPASMKAVTHTGRQAFALIDWPMVSTPRRRNLPARVARLDTVD